MEAAVPFFMGKGITYYLSNIPYAGTITYTKPIKIICYRMFPYYSLFYVCDSDLFYIFLSRCVLVAIQWQIYLAGENTGSDPSHRNFAIHLDDN